MATICKICGMRNHSDECRLCAAKKEFERFPPAYHLRIANAGSRSAEWAVDCFHSGRFMSPDKFDQYFGKSLFITGPVRGGKTTLALSILYYHMIQFNSVPERFSRRKTFWFTKVGSLFLSIKGSYGKDPNFENEIIEKLKNVDILILDDLGAERITDWSLSLLYIIIDHRYEESKQTIFTSNLGLNDIARNLGDERITRRISDICITIEMK